MTYKITSIERIDGTKLPSPMPKGFARWKAVVEFWDGPADGAAPLSDLFILDRPTQYATPNGDDWSLKTKEDTLIDVLTGLIESTEDLYLQKIRDGNRGYLGSPDPSVHGTVLPADAIANDNKVRAIVNVAKTKAPK